MTKLAAQLREREESPPPPADAGAGAQSRASGGVEGWLITQTLEASLSAISKHIEAAFASGGLKNIFSRSMIMARFCPAPNSKVTGSYHVACGW